MTETDSSMSSMQKTARKTSAPVDSQRAAVRELVRAARARGDGLTGPDGLLKHLSARYRRAANAKGHFPTEQAAGKTLYLVTRSLDPKGTGQARWVTRWKPALNAFAITFADRMPTAEDL